MHLGATVHHWLLIVLILLKPKSGREAKARRAEAEENYCKSSTKINCGGSFSRFSVVASKASAELDIQGSCRNNLTIRVLTWNQFKMLSQYYY